MLVSISIQNFGYVKEKQTLSFELSPADVVDDNYIINAGNMRLLKMLFIGGKYIIDKTDFVYALDFVYTMIKEPFEKINKLNYDKFYKLHTDENSIIHLVYYHIDTKFSYEIEFNEFGFVREELYVIGGSPQLLLNRTTNLKNRKIDVKFKEGLLDEIGEHFLKALLPSNLTLAVYKNAKTRNTILDKALEWFDTYSASLLNEKLPYNQYISQQIFYENISKRHIIRLLNKIKLPVSKIYVLKDRFNENMFELYDNIFKNAYNDEDASQPNENYNDNDINIAKFFKINFVFESEEFCFRDDLFYLPLNIQKFYTAAGIIALCMSQPTIFSFKLIDIDMNYDTFYNFVFLYLANVKNSQFIATVNNIDLLIGRNIIAPQSIYFLKKDDKFFDHLYRLSDLKNTQSDTTFDVYQFLDMPKYDTAPNINDFYVDFSARANVPNKKKKK